MARLRVGDAFVRGSEDGATWTVGTKAVEIAYAVEDGRFTQTGFRNKLASPPMEYIPEGCAIAPVTVGAAGDGPWALTSATAVRTSAGGQPVAMLALDFACENLAVHFRVIAYPGTSVLRQWVELENTGASSLTAEATVLTVPIADDPTTPFTHYWMVGGNSKADQGMMQSAPVTPNYQQVVAARATYDFMPWTALHRSGEPDDGWFVALEYLGNWSLAVERADDEPLHVTAAIPDLDAVPLAPGQRIALPAVTVGVFAGTLDDMAVQSYDWQYRYLWDYTNMDYYARPKWAVPWTYCARNLQEQFAERLAYLDMNADVMRGIGFEMLWDDAGWSSFDGLPPDNYGSVFTPTYEGPDFRQTRRYLEKMGMGWLAWFAGRPTPGVMAGKVGAWGDFEWRTDAVEFPDWAADRDLRDKIVRFLDRFPRSSFHTCSGGSSYSHTAEIQRYANTNYFSDHGRGLQTNHYFSYIEPPDKWVDIIETFVNPGVYKPETSRQTMTMVPFWGLHVTPDDQECLRRDLETYRFLRHEGVAGRWSYMFHPGVIGGTDFYYAQRTSRDRTKACIIFKHKAPGPVTIFPRGLLPGHEYVVGFDSVQATVVRDGADLMASGIEIAEQTPGELIYLGLPNRPGSGLDRTAPTAPANVLARRETNIGHSGVGLYWSAGADESWLSYYEVKRGTEILGKVSIGTYYFDHAEGWDPDAAYAVRTVGGDGNMSAWTPAARIADEPVTAYALGGLFPVRGREGWCADTTADGVIFEPMSWVTPPKTSSADEGGTPNQPGGIEGWWEGQGGARLGRAWMQSSPDACSVRTWVAPKAGTVRIVSRVMKEWYRQAAGTPLRARILHGGRQIWPEEGWAEAPLNDLVGATHDLTLAVKEGDPIRFVLDKSADPENDIAAWMPRITYAEPSPSEPNGSVVRILCGTRKPYTDRAGGVWSSDRFFEGGHIATSKSEIHSADDPALYRRSRCGSDFSYAIPVRTGLYAVRLKFAEPEYERSFARPFNVEINGREMLRNFDICQDARGWRKAHDRVFRYVVPNADGNIVLHFTGGTEPWQETDEAIVQAIEVLPESTTTVRINCGGEADFVDWNSFVWSADREFAGGEAIRSASPVAQASPTLYDQALYHTARSGREVSYTLSLPPALYTVHLKFAELWLAEPGKRPMDIEINGRTVWASWDPGTEAGQAGMACDLRELNVAPDKNGKITILVRAAGENDAILQAIEVE
jgi:hypothetical protein